MATLVGSFLVARPTLRDPSFAGSVVLILQHSEEGALGLVVNRPLEAEGLPFPVFAGGPCQTPGLFMLHGHRDWSHATDAEVAPGIFVGDQDCLERATALASAPENLCRVFLGYAGWGPGQVESELASGAWAVAPATGDVLFHTSVPDIWDRLAPPGIPQPSLN